MSIQLVTKKIQPAPDYHSPHYLVNNTTLYSKLQALELCEQTNIEWPTFKVWPNTSGHGRPLESFWQLAVSAAEQLAQCHDSVRLWYSGGTDSHAVLEAMLQSGNPPQELATYRRFIGAVDESVNIEVDVFPMREFLADTLNRYGVDIPLRVYDILPDHFSWYMQEPHNWFVHKHIGPTSMNAVICHEVYPELQTDGMVNVIGCAAPTVEHNNFHWLDGDFNLNFMTPRSIHFFADPRWPKLAAAYAYGIHDCSQLGIDDSGQIKQKLGFPKLGNLLDQKWIFPRVDGKVIHRANWKYNNKKEILLQSNAYLSEQGTQTLTTMYQYIAQVGTNTRWFNDGDIHHDYVGSVSESHQLLDA
jgi:hypothetical protein